MGLNFMGGERIQRGRGIGGLLRVASKLFTPISKLAKKALRSDPGKRILNAVKEQAVDSSVNVVKGIANGGNIKETLKDEFQNVKKNAKKKAVDIGVDFLKEHQAKRLRKGKTSKGKKKSKPVRDRRDIFD